MSASVIALIILGCVFGAAMLGMLTRLVLPAHHLSSDTKDTVKLAMGLVATMTALILGLLVASAKGSYDTQRDETTRMGAKIAFLDVLLAHYGPEAADTRETLRAASARLIGQLWLVEVATPLRPDPKATGGEAVYAAIEALAPQTEAQRAIKAQSLAAAIELGQMRWLLYEQSTSAISPPLLIVVVAWLAVIFFSFGLFAPSNSTVVAALLISSLSVSGAVLLILELDHPFDGLIRISSEPMRKALEPMPK